LRQFGHLPFEDSPPLDDERTLVETAQSGGASPCENRRCQHDGPEPTLRLVY
jgi:hypothetical protein